MARWAVSLLIIGVAASSSAPTGRPRVVQRWCGATKPTSTVASRASSQTRAELRTCRPSHRSGEERRRSPIHAGSRCSATVRLAATRSWVTSVRRSVSTPSSRSASVPISPELVVILRAHLTEFGADADGRPFRGEREGAIPVITYDGRVWQRVRELALTPEVCVRAGQDALHPAARRRLDLAQRWSAGHAGRQVGRPLGRGPAQGLRHVP